MPRSINPRPRRIGIIGAGPGGLCAAIRLREAGFDDITIFEKSSEIGGTWNHNRYPGAECDVPSHLYSFSFAIKQDWSRPYANQPEIKAYLDDIVERFDLARSIRFDTEVRGAHWDDECLVWRVDLGGGEVVELDVVISAQGMFNHLHVPDIAGLDEFSGTMFHSARWPRDHDLSGERVAVIGSAASAVQFVPEIAKVVAHLDLYQRTANWVLPKDDTPFTDEQLAALADPIAARQLRGQIFRRVDQAITFSNPVARQASEEAGRRNLEQVLDPGVRAKLTPTVPYGAKRPLLSNVFYPTFNRPNVNLVTEPIAKVTADAVVTVDGTERPVDTIVLATGFQTTRYLSTFPVTGRDGVRLDDAWSTGAQAYLGITTSGFPNLFMLYGPNTNNGSIIFMLECQVAYFVRQLERMQAEELAYIDVKPDVMAAYNEGLQRDLDAVEVWRYGTEHSYYRETPTGRIVTQWPHTMTEYRRRTMQPDVDAYDVCAGRPLAGL